MRAQPGPLRDYLHGSSAERLGLLRADAIAGLATAAVLIPQAMGYALLAGLPPIVGLYAGVLPPVAYALLGRSRHLSVGPVALDSLLVAAAIAPIAVSGTAGYLAAAVALCAMVGSMQVLGGLLGAGSIANLLSRPVLSGFTSAAALIIGCSQLSHLLAIELPGGHDILQILTAAVAQADAWHRPTLLVSLISITTLVGLRRLAPSVPGALIVLAGGVGASVGLDLPARGVATVGDVPHGLPTLSLPAIDVGLARALWPAALTIAVVAFVETVSIAKQLGRRTGDQVRPSRELLAIGTANLCSSVCGGYNVTASFSRSAVQSQAGARTPAVGLFVALMSVGALTLLTPLLRHVPMAGLSGVIVTSIAGLFDPGHAKTLYRVKRSDFWLLVFTFGTTLTLGIQYGIAAGVLASLATFVINATRPHVALLGRIPDSEAYLNVRRHPHVQQVPGVLLVRVDAQFFFGNVSFLRHTLRALEAQMDAPLRAVVIDAAGINQLDSSAADALREIDDAYQQRGVRLILTRVKGPVRDVLQRTGMLQQLTDEGRIFLRTHEAVQALTEGGQGQASRD